MDTKVKPTRQRRECMYFGIYCPPRFGFDDFFSLNKPRLIYLPPSLSKATSIKKIREQIVKKPLLLTVTTEEIDSNLCPEVTLRQ